MSAVRRAVAIMCKRPAAGHTKTRLVGDRMSPDAAADLYACFLTDVVALVADDPDAHLVLAIDEPEAAAWFSDFAPAVRQVVQRGATLGERLDGVMTELLDDGFDQVFALSSDSPDLPPGHLTAAFRLLNSESADVVLGPVEDGGYWTIGWKRRWATVVTNVEMSTPSVLVDTLAECERVGARVSLAPSWYDVDVPEDLERLADSIAADESATSRFLASLA